MDWEPLVIPLLTAAAWIVYSILRRNEPEKPTRSESRRDREPVKAERVEERRAEPAALEEEAKPTSRSSSDLNQFMKEVQERRQRREEEQAAREVAPAPRPRRRVPRPPVVPVAPIPEVLPVIEAIPVVRPALSLVTEPAARPAAELPPALGQLLRTAEGMRTAIILQEVLGPPRSKR